MNAYLAKLHLARSPLLPLGYMKYLGAWDNYIQENISWAHL